MPVGDLNRNSWHVDAHCSPNEQGRSVTALHKANMNPREVLNGGLG